MRDEEIRTHPSYGVISFCRSQGGKPTFFGSDVQPDSYISMEIKTAEENVDLGKSWFFPRKHIVSLRMTNHQFAELITSLNNGSGTPCTIESIQGVRVEQEVNKEYKVDFHKRKMKEISDVFMKNIVNRMNELNTISQKLSKKDQEVVNRISGGIIQDMNSNFPFYMEQFYKEMETVAQEIKINMEADLEAKIQRFGLDTIKNIVQQNNLKLEE